MIEKSKALLEKLIRLTSLNRAFFMLQKVPGVGPVIASALRLAR